MLSETGENRGRTLKLRSEKEENIGITLILGCGKQEKFCPFLKQKGDGNKKFPQPQNKCMVRRKTRAQP
jgi:hypothetical protein